MQVDQGLTGLGGDVVGRVFDRLQDESLAGGHAPLAPLAGGHAPLAPLAPLLLQGLTGQSNSSTNNNNHRYSNTITHVWARPLAHASPYPP